MSDAELERDYWRKRAEDAERKEREAARLATTAEIECDRLRVTLSATRAELDRVLTLAVEDRKHYRTLPGAHCCAQWATYPNTTGALAG